MLFPEVKEEIRKKLLAEYDKVDISASSYDEASAQLLRQIYTLQSIFSDKSRAPDPQIKTTFGKEAIQPLAAPMQFALKESAGATQFLPHMTPWTSSASSALQSLLMREQDKVTKERTLAPLFEFDLNALKRQAGCDALRNHEGMRNMQIEFMKDQIDHVQQSLINSSACQLNPLYLEAHGIHCTTTGLLGSFAFTEPPEPNRTGNEDIDQADLKKQLAESQLNDDDEIDQLLNDVLDPFADVDSEVDDAVSGEAVISKFLIDFKDLQAKQVEIDQKQRQKQHAEEEHQQHVAEQHHLVEKAPESDEDGEEDGVEETNMSELQPPEEMINTESKKEENSKEPDAVDAILEKSDAYQKAVQQTTQVLADAESTAESKRPQRGNARMRILHDLANKPQDNWVVTDSIPVKNFKELVPTMALEFGFELDEFQKRAIYRLEQGSNVMVAAHTSAGKTVVAEYAIALSRAHMTKTIYTSPIKSLSNQKYRDFKLKFGDVGVVTGDVQLNQDASCLIMTTEVLQSMLYNNSSKIQDVEWVIFDEVHYINDEERGSVWEEVIIKLPDTVNIVMLSATVPNYLEFANWVGRTKQKKVYVQYTQNRPVPLEHHALIDGQVTLLKAHGQNVNSNDLKRIANNRKMNLNNSQNQSRDEKQKMQDKQAKELQKMIKDNDKNKKIDFKEKAIMAKEGAIKKIVAHAQAQANQAQKGPNAAKRKFANFQKSLLNIQKMKLLPIIVFAFSRAGCLELAESLEPMISFTDGYTKGIIMKFIKQKLQRLDEKDRNLPQIKALTALLVRGIGVHHAGLLQILKEIVEILFSDGYLKVVFATSTFAIGLNLPARSVLFTQLKKFDGSEMATITTSEYLQMAGRAGRRGKDDRGFSLISFDPEHGKIPNNTEITELLESQGVTLESQLKVDYRTCLNVLKQDEGDIGSLLENSFFANENQNVKLQNIKHQRKIEPLYERSKDIECIHSVPDEISTLYDQIDALWEVNWKLNETRPPEVLQIVEVTSAKHVLKNMVVLTVNTKNCLCLYIQKENSEMGWPIQYDESNQKDYATCKQRAKLNRMVISGETYLFEYVVINWDMISKYYQNRIPDLNRLHFVQRNHLHEKTLGFIISHFAKMESNLVEEPYKVDKKKKKRAEYVGQQQDVIAKIKATKCYGCEQISYHLTQVDLTKSYKAQLDDIQKILSGGLDEKETEFNSRTAVLTQYKIVDNDLNLLFKGKVAVKVSSADNILLTEFFFSGLLKELTDQEILAIISLFNNQQRAPGNQPECIRMYSENFKKAYQFVIEETEKLITLEETFSIGEEKNFSKRLNFCFYEAVYDWADGCDFIDIISDCGIEEGIVIKMFMTVDRIRQSLVAMAKVVGDNALAKRLEEMKPLMDRGIVKMQSLYLEVEQDMPKMQEDDEDIQPAVKEEESKV